MIIIAAAILLQGILAVQYYYTRSLLADELEKSGCACIAGFLYGRFKSFMIISYSLVDDSMAKRRCISRTITLFLS